MLVLTIILKILADLLLTVLGLIVLLLVIPFNYSGQVLVSEGYKVRCSFGWAWKALNIIADVEDEDVDVSLHVFNKRVYKLKSGRTAAKEDQGKTEEEKQKKKEKKEKRGFDIRDFTKKELIEEIFEYIKRIIRIAKPKYMHLYGTYGFDDPSLTGMISGIVGIIRGLVPDAKLHLTPVFDEEIFDLDFRAEGSVAVGSIAYQTVRTALKKPIRKILFKKKK
ncbi:MAG: DUF2953 domain-containing protein [Caulobacteraceae bacterium]